MRSSRGTHASTVHPSSIARVGGKSVLLTLEATEDLAIVEYHPFPLSAQVGSAYSNRTMSLERSEAAPPGLRFLNLVVNMKSSCRGKVGSPLWGFPLFHGFVAAVGPSFPRPFFTRSSFAGFRRIASASLLASAGPRPCRFPPSPVFLSRPASCPAVDAAPSQATAAVSPTALRTSGTPSFVS
jgi:hypothetical protein